MGQYWKIVNLDKREYIDPHKLGSGMKLWEQLVNTPGVGAALIILCAAMPKPPCRPRGGGDLKLDNDVARRTIGRWAGDRVCLVGEYAEDSDLPCFPGFSNLYSLCVPVSEIDDSDEEDKRTADQLFTDVSDGVCAIIERELGGKFEGDGWRHFKTNN